MMSNFSSRIPRGIFLLFLIAACSVVGFLIWKNLSTKRELDITPTASSVKTVRDVTALGRIQPKGEIISVSTSEIGKISRFYVKEGDYVKTNQIIADLDSLERRQLAVEVAQGDLEVSLANLLVVQSGSKQGLIDAQQLKINQLQAQLQGEIATRQAAIDRLTTEKQQAESDFIRNKVLADDGAIATAALESYQLQVQVARKKLQEAIASRQGNLETLEQQIQAEKAVLNQLVEVRPVDIQQAQAQVNRAESALKQAQKNLEISIIRSSIDAQVLKINTRVGESVNSGKNIVDLGQTQQMIAIIEVDESDISRVQLGQKVIIQSETNTFTGQLNGTVSQIGLQVGRNSTIPINPINETSEKVVQVYVKLEPQDSQRVAKLSNVQVLAIIKN
jgi:HlyD family secretion protein